jgi:hypothetical protein
MWLSVGDFVRGDHDFRNRYSGEAQPPTCQTSNSGRDHAPAPLRNRADEFDSPGHYGHAITIIGFTSFQLASFRFSVEMRSNGANHFDGANAVADSHQFISVNSIFAGPGAPLALHRARGIHENSIEIEENCGAMKSGHPFF